MSVRFYLVASAAWRVISVVIDSTDLGNAENDIRTPGKMPVSLGRYWKGPFGLHWR